jgi:ribosomal-protein-alanine N-acetyltransferase
MTEPDCAVVAGLEKEIFSMPWSEEGFRSAVLMPQNVFLVAEEAGEICGYLGMYASIDEGEITNVGVAPSFRNRGIGWKLVQAALGMAKQQDLAQVVLEVRVSNASAIHLYEKCGFVNVGIRKGFYEQPKEDAYITIYNWEG